MITFDKLTKRRKDENGFLHVDFSHISKEVVNPYMGNEIPGYKELGLIPDKLYQCYRKGSEIKKGAKSFNGLPILWGHKAESADAPQKKDRVGSMGTDAKFSQPYLDNSLIFTDKKAVDAIESGERVELSCSYRWKPVVQAGKFNEQAYDIIMTEIQGNHLGLVEEGRAGSDVMVHDEKIKETKMTFKDKMFKLAGSITGLLAFDGAEQKEEEIIKKVGEAVEEFKGVHKQEKKEMKKDVGAMDSEGMKKAFDNMSEDEKSNFMEMIKGKKEKKADDQDPEKKKAEDAEAEKKAKDEEAKKKADDEENKKCADEEKAKESEKANDEMKVEIKNHCKTLTAAADDVRPVVGNLEALSFDSAEAIYKKALELQKIDVKGHEPSAYKGMFSVHKAHSNTKTPVMANDSKTELSGHFAGLKNTKIS